MKRVWVVVFASLALNGVPAWAHEEHAAAPGDGTQTLTGEVVDTFCDLSHGAKGQGKSHMEQDGQHLIAISRVEEAQ